MMFSASRCAMMDLAWPSTAACTTKLSRTTTPALSLRPMSGTVVFVAAWTAT